MRPPCEVVVRRVLPVLRALVAQELMNTYGWTQSQTARRLGVTQPAVSGYASLLSEAKTVKLGLGALSAVARKIAKGLATGGLSTSETMTNICTLCIKLKSGGIVCTLHKQRVPDLAEESCEACFNLFAGRVEQVEERREVLNNIKRAITMIENCDEFVETMPEVRVNVVMATRNAENVSEVAGVPGRIIEVMERARALMEPEFGSSFHLAKVLLSAMELDKGVRAVTNIKYGPAVDAAIRRLGFNLQEFNRKGLSGMTEGDVPAALGVQQVIGKFGKTPDVVVDIGEYGIEPTSYVFGATAVEAAGKAIKIARALT